MKRILSIIAAGCLALLAGSCVKEELATVDISKATPPTMVSVTVDDNVAVQYTPAVFNMSFNKKMATYHTLALVSIDGKETNYTLSTKNDGSTLTLNGKSLSNLLKGRGYVTGDMVLLEIVVRGSIQDPSRGITNGFVDSHEKYGFSWAMPDDTVPGNPWEDFTETSSWGMIGSIASTGNNWNADGPMYSTPDGTRHVARNVKLAPGDQFKVRKDGGWDTNFGAPGDTEPYVMTVGEAIEATPGGKNLGVAADGNYDLLLDEEAGTLTLFSAYETYPGFDEVSTWSVIGNIASVPMEWNKDIQMTTDGEWHVAEGVVLTTADQFKFRKDLAWTDNFGAAGDTEPFVVELDMEYDAVGGGKNLAVPADGTYDLLVNPGAQLYKVVESLGGKSPLVGGDTPDPGKPAVWSLIGTIGGTGWDTDTDMTNTTGDIWVARLVTLTANDEFKIRADHDWAESYGGPEANDHSTIDPENPYDVYKPELGVAFAAGDKNIHVGVAGTYDVTFDYANKTIKIDSHVAAYSLIGEINGSNWDNDFVMNEKDGVWTSPVVEITGGFKIRFDFSWDDANTYGVTEGFTPEVGVPFTAVQPGGNITVPEAGQYKVQFTPETKEVLIQAVAYPEHLYMIGDEFGGWDWNSDGVVEMTPVLHNPDWGANAEGQFYTVRYFSAGKGFKFCSVRDWKGDFWGLTENDGFTEAGGNCTVAEDGFYLVHIDLKNEKVHVEPARVYGIGEAFGSWDEEKEENLFQADGKTLKVTLPKAGNLRMYVASSISTSGWWTREFDIFDGQIVPRLMEELALVPVLAGQVVTLNFNEGTGTITGEGEAPAYKTEISVPGAYSGSEWDLDKAPKLLGKGDGEFKGALVMYKQGDAAVEFKFGHDGSWIGGTADGLNFTLGANDNMTIDEGTYFWTVNLESKAATALKVEKVGLIGSFNDWSDDVVLTFNPEDHTYNGTVTLGENAELKVRFNGNWDYSLGGDLNRLQAVNDNCKVVEAGTYTAKLDLNKGTLTLTK